MTPLVYYAERDKKKAAKMFDALSTGMATRGCRLRWAEDLGRAERAPAVFYGMSAATCGALRAYQEGARDFYYIDNAYFGRGKYYRITRGALQHSGVPDGRIVDARRLVPHGVEIKPWRPAERDGPILVVLQSELWFELHELPAREWVARVVGALREHTGRDVVVRAKPPPREIDPRTFPEVLAGAWAVVTWSSNAAVQAVLEGVPAFTWVDCAATAMGSKDLSLIERPPTPPGRRRWAQVLASNQWTRAEVASGRAWRDLHEKAPK